MNLTKAERLMVALVKIDEAIELLRKWRATVYCCPDKSCILCKKNRQLVTETDNFLSEV